MQFEVIDLCSMLCSSVHNSVTNNDQIIYFLCRDVTCSHNYPSCSLLTCLFILSSS